MPITAPNGQTVKGLYGGYRAGQKDEQRYRGTEADIESVEISNTAKQADFLEWLDRRDVRDVQAEAQKSSARTIIGTEDERTKYTKTKYKADTRKGEEYLSVADEEEELRKVELERGIQSAIRGLRNDQVDALATVFSGVGHDEEMTEGIYSNLYNQAINTVGEDFLESVGVSDTPTIESIEAINALKNQSVHTQETRIREHLLPLELYWKNRLAQGSASGESAASILGKMMQDQEIYIQEAMQFPEGSPGYKRAMAKYSFMQSQIDAHLGKEQAVSESKQEENFNNFIIKTFPTFAADLESDTGDTVQANAFIKNVYNELSNRYGERSAKQMIQKYYRYDANSWDANKFVVQDTSEGVQYSASIEADIENVDTIIREFTGLRNLGASGQQILVDEILRREKEETEQLKKDIHRQTYPPVK